MPAILIVEDDAGVRGVLKAMLEREGYRVVAAEDGDQGLRHARAEPPALAIVDVEMPGMNGFDVCSLIKTDPRLQHVPVVMMTGRPVAGVPARAQAAGACDLWAKPFDRELIVAKVAALLGKKK